MGLTLQLLYHSAADLRAHLFEHSERGAVLLPMSDPPEGVQLYAPVGLEVVAGEGCCAVPAEVLQVLPGNGLVVRLTDVTAAAELVKGAPIAEPGLPPVVRLSLPELDLQAAPENTEGASREPELDAQAEPEPEPDPEPEPELKPDPVPDDGVNRGGTKPKIGGHIAGSSPISWSFEQLQATWDQLTASEKVRVARHGKRPARMMILKGLDKTLHVHVLNNSGITPEEIAMMATMSSLEPTVLRRIAADVQWLRHSAVARNLLCNPKMTMPQITKILSYVARDDLSRLARTGKVRQSVRQLIVKKLDRTR